MTNAGRPSEHVPRATPKDAVPGRDVPRPQLGPSDAMLTATGPLTMPGPGEQWGRPQDDTRPVLHGAGDAVTGAPLSPPPAAAVSSSGMMLGVDAAGGYAVPKQLDGPAKPRKHRRP
jgi:hypothetical protein